MRRRAGSVSTSVEMWNLSAPRASTLGCVHEHGVDTNSVKLTIPAGPMLQHGSHGARRAQHEADKPDRVHEHGGSWGAEVILSID
jgi:hypothetical protein